jgi:membrane associated rhomboid family serine protease
MIPIRDVIPSRTTPWVTLGLIAASTLVFLVQQALPPAERADVVGTFALVPALATPITVLTSLFVHDGWAPWLGTMTYLWLFGDTLEDRLGHLRFAGLFLLCGAAAATVHVAGAPSSLAPVPGAAGAVSGVLGAYLVLFPGSRVLTVVPLVLLVHFVEVPALLLVGLWFLVHALGAAAPVAHDGARNPALLALLAHTASFAAGMLAVHLLRRPERERVEWWDLAR